MDQLNPLAKSLIAATVLHALCYLCWGMYYSEFSDRFFTAYVDGSFSGGITKPIFYNYGFFTALSHLMAVGYHALPQLNWYGIFGQGFMVLATTGFLWLLGVLVSRFAGRGWASAGIIIFLLPFWCYHIVLYRTTELAFLACGISILGLVVSYFPMVQERWAGLKAARVFFTVLLLLAVFIRLEPTLMCTAIFLPYGLWVVKDRSARVGLFKISLVVLPVFVGAYTLYLAATGPAEKLFRDTRVYTHTLWDFGQDERLFTLSTAADSIKLEAAQSFFISDEAALGPAFYQRIGVIPLEKSLGSLGGYFEGFDLRIIRAFGIWQQLVITQPVFFIANAMAFLFAVVLLFYNGRGRQWWLMLALQLWFWAILFGVTVFMKMELRVMAPLITLSLVTLTLFPVLLLPEGWLVKRGNRTLLLLAGICLLLPAALKGLELYQATHQYWLGKENIKTFKAELSGPRFEGRIVVFNSFAWQLLYADLFDNNEFARNSNYIAIDNGELYMYPQFKHAMKALCGGYGVQHMAQYLVQNKEQVLIVSDAPRMELMQRYIETVYGIPFGYRPHPGAEASVLHNPKGGFMMPGYAEHLSYSIYQLN